MRTAIAELKALKVDREGNDPSIKYILNDTSANCIEALAINASRILQQGDCGGVSCSECPLHNSFHDHDMQMCGTGSSGVRKSTYVHLIMNGWNKSTAIELGDVDLSTVKPVLNIPTVDDWYVVL